MLQPKFQLWVLQTCHHVCAPLEVNGAGRESCGTLLTLQQEPGHQWSSGKRQAVWGVWMGLGEAFLGSGESKERSEQGEEQAQEGNWQRTPLLIPILHVGWEAQHGFSWICVSKIAIEQAGAWLGIRNFPLTPRRSPACSRPAQDAAAAV